MNDDTKPQADPAVAEELMGVPEELLMADGDTYQCVWPQVRIRGEISGQAQIGRAKIVFGDVQRDPTAYAHAAYGRRARLPAEQLHQRHQTASLRLVSRSPQAATACGRRAASAPRR